MTNLEFYKEEIKKEIKTHSYSHATSTYESLVSCYKKFCNKSSITDSYEILDWLCEEHQILDKKEKEYLSAVIRPFRNKVKYIVKWQHDSASTDETFIAILLNKETILLPYFESNIMYKGMELNKKYTLKELGL